MTEIYFAAWFIILALYLFLSDLHCFLGCAHLPDYFFYLICTALIKILFMFLVLGCQFQSHYDIIICLRIIERNERTLILSASGDRCIQLSDIEGVNIGCFGQVAN